MTTFTPTRQASTRSSHEHHNAQGFCTVCGSTWPCWGARVDGSSVVATRTTAPLLALPPC